MGGGKTDSTARCTHLQPLREKCKKKILARAFGDVGCHYCDGINDLWACLTCGIMLCGLVDHAHAQTHNEESGHPVVMQLVNGMCFCYTCDAFVDGATRNGDFQVFRNIIMEGKQGHDTARSRRRTRAAGAFDLTPPSANVVGGSGFHMSIGRKRKRTVDDNDRTFDTGELCKRVRKGEGDEDNTPGRIGLRNLGNTCFMNAVLQALSNTSRFREYFLKLADSAAQKNTMLLGDSAAANRRRTVQPKEISVSWEMKQVLQDLWSANEPAISPISLRGVLTHLLPRYSLRQQQDSHEFLRYLLDRLHVELTKGKGTRDAHRHMDSVVFETFQGLLVDEISCSKCRWRSKRKDPFLDLSLDIPSAAAEGSSSVKLIDCLHRFTRWEFLHDSDHQACPSCGRESGVMKKFSIATPPRVLCLHLKRFEWHPPLPRCKISTPVEFPDELEFGDFTSCGLPCQYTLSGVITHHGTTTRSGHYTACCLNQGQWYQFDDSVVAPTTREKVLEREGYILFYTLE